MEPALRRRLLAALAVGLVVVVLAARHFARGGGTSASAAGQAHPVLAADAAATPHGKIVVHVVGAVRRPGLYALRDGARIADAVRRAGGTTRKADLEAVNLAAPVEDGLQVVVPRRAPPVGAGAGEPGTAPAGCRRPRPPQHGHARAARHAARSRARSRRRRSSTGARRHGAFTSVDDLDAIPGIGPARLEQLRDLVAP